MVLVLVPHSEVTTNGQHSICDSRQWGTRERAICLIRTRPDRRRIPSCTYAVACSIDQAIDSARDRCSQGTKVSICMCSSWNMGSVQRWAPVLGIDIHVVEESSCTRCRACPQLSDTVVHTTRKASRPKYYCRWIMYSTPWSPIIGQCP